MVANAEWLRLQDVGVPWKKWGPYLSERQWGTVREDYSEDGQAWEHFTWEQSHYRTYRWGEDGLAGLSDDQQVLCLSLAMWNGADPVLKERLFGLTNAEGNHGEDVKEYYFYLDSTPTHSYMKYLYKYPQVSFPYLDLVQTNRRRSRYEFEYELLDTGAFDADRYFDVFVEYAKAGPEDILVRITACNRASEAAIIHLLPTLTFRNTWSWSPARTARRPAMRQHSDAVISARHRRLGERFLLCSGGAELLFTENETNMHLLARCPNPTPYVKDAFHGRVVRGYDGATNPAQLGTKAAAWYTLRLEGGGQAQVQLRLTDSLVSPPQGPEFDAVFDKRRREADDFYAALTPTGASDDDRRILRQAYSGMLWTKQYYYFDLDRWLTEHAAHPFQTGARRGVRNEGWVHMTNSDIISMPDKWEYPWYAAWDLALHAVALSSVDIQFAKEQLGLMLRDAYLHPNGQMPAYEWNFGDVNPPVHAWASLFVYLTEKGMRGQGDIAFLKQIFQKLLMNFTWWVNRKDPGGRNLFQGGFLGLDNIGVFDRSAPLPTGGHLEQADGTSWMVFFCQVMLEIALELALHDPSYEDLALKFVQHLFWITAAMEGRGSATGGMWDEEDGFYYDLLRLPDGTAFRVKVRSMVGLLPLCATTVISQETYERFPGVVERATKFLQRHPELFSAVNAPTTEGVAGRRLISLLDEHRLRRVLARLLDEAEFLGPYGIRSLSRWHEEHPYRFSVKDQVFEVRYEPAESRSGMFGGNSNWRGPVWFPINALIVRALVQLYSFYGDSFTVECPVGSGRHMNLFEVSQEIGSRMLAIFRRDENGRRPLYGGTTKFQTDPHWRDYILFYEYFHGDEGAGLGASHQTGWTGLVGRLLQFMPTSATLIRDTGGRSAVMPQGVPASEQAAPGGSSAATPP